MDLISVQDVDYLLFEKLKAQAAPRGNPHGRKKNKRYCNAVCAFDIETTTLPDLEQAIMYIWQFQLDETLTIIGRTWEEFLEFLRNVREAIRPKVLCMYVHNLSFEFQFLKGIYAFQQDEVFAVEPRKVLKCTMYDTFEFRCSYLHSNMSLAAFTKKMGVPDAKLSDFDYSKVRYPWTELTEDEIHYCINDVRGLVQALKREMSMDHDTLYTIPLTSTGYVRCDCKRAMEDFNHAQLMEMLPDAEVYTLLREGFRGGNVHANRWMSGDIIPGVYGQDLCSAYPAAMILYKYPMKPFFHEGPVTLERLMDLLQHKKKALLFRICFYDIKLISRYTGVPYLARDKCRNIQGGRFDNGRILEADYLETTITDLDFRIIMQQYDWSAANPFDLYYSRYGKLPKPLRDTVIKYFRLKTELKQNPGDPYDPDKEYFYFKAKNKLNSLYGMCAQDPVKDSIDFIDGVFIQRNDPVKDLLAKSYRKAFLSYAWGVWVTCWCRTMLQRGIDAAGDRFVYCDTDSVKSIGPLDMSAYNDEIRALAEKNGGYADDPTGKRHYLGVFEDEYPDGLESFVTLGAKKYAYVEKGKLHITIAGVNKKKGAVELGKIENFKEGFIFRDAGGTESIYNDNIHYPYFCDGHWVTITDNVVIRNSTYELGVTEEYRRILNGCAEIKYSDHDIPGLYTLKR